MEDQGLAVALRVFIYRRGERMIGKLSSLHLQLPFAIDFLVLCTICHDPHARVSLSLHLEAGAGAKLIANHYQHHRELPGQGRRLDAVSICPKVSNGSQHTCTFLSGESATLEMRAQGADAAKADQVGARERSSARDA